MVKAVRHFGIVVSNLEKSLRFYRDLLGLQVARRMEESGSYLDNMLGLKNVQVTTIKLAAGSGPAMIELLAFGSHAGAVERQVYSTGPSHVAFTVDHLDQLFHRLSQEGVCFNAPPQLSPDGRVKVTYCKDPDGTPLELVEILA